MTLVIRPDDLFARWPVDRPLVALRSGHPDRPRSRWSVFATPTEYRRCTRSGGRAVWHSEPDNREILDAHPDPLVELERFTHAEGTHPGSLVPGWIGFLSYNLGPVIEPATRHATPAPDDRGWPLMVWARVESALVHDNADDSWTVIGDPADLPPLNPLPAQSPPGFEFAPTTSTTGKERFCRDTERVIGFIRAGDVFQANLTHRLSGGFAGSARSLFADLSRTATPWYGAYIELPDIAGVRRSILSVSPELFLEVDPATRRVTTRPMKGTRPADLGHELADSEKDRAELNMITDLMRNDLGRICDLGSVRVDNPRTIEPHADGPGGVHQGVSTVSGTLRNGAGIADLLGATFPPGSITGAPKIRAMQIIDQLEPVARGPYCGAIGLISDSGRVALSVAIRTALLSGQPSSADRGRINNGTLDYSVGAGIVADSDPEAEWDETMTKAGVLNAISLELT